MSQDTVNEIYFSENKPLKDAWKLWRILFPIKKLNVRMEELLEMLKVKPSPNILALDAGSGHGAYSKLLSDKGYTIVGADVSSFHMRNAKKKYDIIPFLICDLLHAPFKQETFNIILCSFFLHHFRNLWKVFGQIGRVIKVGGEILIHEPNGNNIVYRFTEKCKCILPRKITQRMGVMSVNETIHQHNAYVDVLLVFGFKNIKVRFVNAIDQEVKFDSVLAKTALHTYGVTMGIIMLIRFLLFKLVLRIKNKSLSCGELIIHAIKTTAVN
jgi:ubiquinone/menaquinone biosynthesis C-methylase UbiE